MAPERSDTTPKRIGLAISGGGHRATIFALGVLLYLVDTGRSRNVRTIASVSGGSILNAFIALVKRPNGSELSFCSLEPEEFDRHAAALANRIAGNPTAWKITIAAMLGSVAASLIVFWLTSFEGAIVLVGLAVVLLSLAVTLAPVSGGSLWGWWGVWIYCAALLWLLAAGVMNSGTLGIPGLEILITVALCGWGLQQRHWIAERAFHHFLRKLTELPKREKGAASLSLEEMNSEVRHVFCATELHSGRHAFFSRDFVYARGFGLGQPAALPVATAVQVSANFPGGFPIRPLKASRFKFSLTDRFEEATEQGIGIGRDILMRDEDIAWMNEHSQWMDNRPLPKRLMLTDGGVFDNVAVDWYLENKSRLDRFRMSLNWGYDVTTGSSYDVGAPRDETILEPLREVSDCLIVVNAGVTAHWRHGLGASVSLPLVGEITGLSQVSSTMYNNYTKERIQNLEEHIIVEMGFSERLVRTTLLPLGRPMTAKLLKAGYGSAERAIWDRLGKTAMEANQTNSLSDAEAIRQIVEQSTLLSARCERLARGEAHGRAKVRGLADGQQC